MNSGILFHGREDRGVFGLRRSSRRFAKRLRQHREHLLRFLDVANLGVTNDQAERMSCPAVHKEIGEIDHVL